MIAMRGVGKLSRHLDPRMVMLVGMACTAVSLYWMAGFTLDEPMSDIIFSGMLQGFGIGTTFVPLSTVRSEEHTSELQSLMRISYDVFCLKKTTHNTTSRYFYRLRLLS